MSQTLPGIGLFASSHRSDTLETSFAGGWVRATCQVRKQDPVTKGVSRARLTTANKWALLLDLVPNPPKNRMARWVPLNFATAAIVSWRSDTTTHLALFACPAKSNLSEVV